MPSSRSAEASELEGALERDGRTVLERLDQWAERRAKKTFVHYGEVGRSLSFAEHGKLTGSLAGAFRELGVGRGDRVAVFLRNPFVTVLAMFAVWRLRAVYCPINFNLSGRLLARQLQDLDAALLVTEEGLVGQLDEVGEDLGFRRCVIHRPLCDEHDFDATVAGVSAPRSLETHDFADLLQAGRISAAEPVEPHDVANILYTSGTTGPSKGVLQSHRWMNQFTFVPRSLIDENDVVYNDLPLYHGAGAVANVVRAAWVGCEVALWDRFSASRFWERVRERGATTAILLDVMIPRLMGAERRARDAENTLHCVNLTPLPEDHHRVARRFGLDVCVTAYGQSETGSGAFAFIDQFPDGGGTPPGLYRGRPKTEVWDFARHWNYPVLRGDEPIRRGLMGRPAAFMEAAILGEHDEILPPESYGQLCFRGRLPGLLFDGYFKRPEATLEACRNLWLHTGDAALMDAQGLLYFVDRMGSFIRSKGENISSYEVEEAINAHPKVAMSAAVGVPALEGEEEDVAVFVVSKPGADLVHAELEDYAGDALPRHMRPRHIRILEELPRTETNKIQKYRLREALLGELEALR